MLSVQDLEYVKSLINTYKKQGYNYYLFTSNSDTNIDTDMFLFLSKNEIIAIDDVSFEIKDGIRILIDTSYRYNEKPNILTMFKDVPDNVQIINKYDYVYSNCTYDYKASESIIYPDILLSGSDTFNSSYICNFLLISIFLYLFIKSILRIGR